MKEMDGKGKTKDTKKRVIVVKTYKDEGGRRKGRSGSNPTNTERAIACVNNKQTLFTSNKI